MGWLALGSALGSTLHIQQYIHVFTTTFRASRLCLIHKIGAENKSFSSPPLNVWPPGGGEQITLYRSRTAYWPCWLLI